MLATGGNLVFEGTTKQTFAAYRATDGALLWEIRCSQRPCPVRSLMSWMASNPRGHAGCGGGAAQIERGAGTALHRACRAVLVFSWWQRSAAAVTARRFLFPIRRRCARQRGHDPAGWRGIRAYLCACHGQLAVGGLKDLRVMDRPPCAFQ